MKTRQQQTGMSIITILIILALIGFFALCAVKLVPPYLEYLSVKKVVKDLAVEYSGDQNNLRGIRVALEMRLNTNQVYRLEPKDVEIFRKGGHTYIDASYEFRTPIMWRIDAVMKFDDLEYEVGEY